jgi:hypothetical protein
MSIRTLIYFVKQALISGAVLGVVSLLSDKNAAKFTQSHIG